MTGEALHPGVFKMDATTGATAVTDYSAEVIKCTVKLPKNLGTHHTLGTFLAQHTEGGGTATIELEGEFSPSASSLHGILRAWQLTGGERTYEIYSPTSSAPSLKVTGEMVLGDLDPWLPIEAGSGDVKKFTAKLGINSMTASVVT